jgi:hypothetical protein
MSEKSGNVQNVGDVLTLKEAVKLMGDEGRRITYLKVNSAT